MADEHGILLYLFDPDEVFMIGRLSGILLKKNPPQLLIDCQGVGYEVDVSMSTVYNLPALGYSDKEAVLAMKGLPAGCGFLIKGHIKFWPISCKNMVNYLR